MNIEPNWKAVPAPSGVVQNIVDLLAVPCALFAGEKPCHEVDNWEKCEPCRAVAMAIFRADLQGSELQKVSPSQRPSEEAGDPAARQDSATSKPAGGLAPRLPGTGAQVDAL